MMLVGKQRERKSLDPMTMDALQGWKLDDDRERERSFLYPMTIDVLQRY